VLSAAFVRSSALRNIPSLGSTAQVFAAIRLELKTFGGAKFSEMDLAELRFFLNGDGEITHTLHELIFNNATEIIVRNPTHPGPDGVGMLHRDCIGEVGYGRDEGLLPYGERSFIGYRLLQEYFCFPQKFLFFT